jgi:signal transduction histidine kinase
LQGLVSFAPSRVERTWVPSPRIEEIRLDGRASRLDARSAFDVPAGTSQVEIRFTGIQLSHLGKVRYRYRLEGVDAEWKESGLRRYALYPKLPPGRHTFPVQAVGPRGRMARAAGILLFRFISTRRLALRLAAAEKLAAVERERVRISRDMHDDLGARLTKIAFFSELAERDIGEGKGSGSFRSVARMSRDAAQALDEMVWAVKPSNDTLAGLTEYICRYATEYLEETELRLRLDLPLNIPVRPLAAEVRHDVYLTIKEALNNVVKHADAQEVTLRLSPGEDGFEVRVVDDGRGFDAGAAAAAGNGLSNMRRRLEQWGGSARITSSPGRGTEVRLWVPLKPLAGH